MGKFKKGAFLGSVVGAGIMWMFTTKKGRMVREKMLDHAGVVYDDVKSKVLASEQWKTFTKQKYLKTVEKAVDKYIAKYPAAKKAKKMMIKVIAAQWKNVQAELKKKKK